jgi:hypothetical protein
VTLAALFVCGGVWRLHLFVTSDRIRDPANSMFASSDRTRLAPGT